MQIATGQSMAGMKIWSIPEIPASNDCMIKSTIREYFEEPLYVVDVWYAWKDYIPCPMVRGGLSYWKYWIFQEGFGGFESSLISMG